MYVAHARRRCVQHGVFGSSHRDAHDCARMQMWDSVSLGTRVLGHGNARAYACKTAFTKPPPPPCMRAPPISDVVVTAADPLPSAPCLPKQPPGGPNRPPRNPLTLLKPNGSLKTSQMIPPSCASSDPNVQSKAQRSTTQAVARLTEGPEYI
eukprot:8378141-Pyramimonas_sp.AAC.2